MFTKRSCVWEMYYHDKWELCKTGVSRGLMDILLLLGFNLIRRSFSNKLNLTRSERIDIEDVCLSCPFLRNRNNKSKNDYVVLLTSVPGLVK